MNAVVVEVRGKFAAVLSDDGSVVKVSNQNYEIGQVIEVKKTLSTRSTMVMRAAAIAAAFVLTFGLGASSYAYLAPNSYVSMDVNPSIEYTLNMFDRVLKVTAVNEDGAQILQEFNLKDFNNKTIDEAIRLTLAEIEKEGYFNGDNQGGIVIATSGKDQKKAEELAETLGEVVKAQCKETGKTVQVETLAADQKMVDEAKALGVTPGKLRLVQELQEDYHGTEPLDVAAWLKKPVKDILQEAARLDALEDAAEGDLDDKDDDKDDLDDDKDTEDDAKEDAADAAKDAEEEAKDAAEDAKDTEDDTKDTEDAAKEDAADAAKDAEEDATEAAKDAEEDAKDAAEAQADALEDAEEDAAEAAKDAQEDLDDAAEDAKDEARDQADKTKDAAVKAEEEAAEKAEQAAEKAEEAAEKAEDAAEDAADAAEDAEEREKTPAPSATPAVTPKPEAKPEASAKPQASAKPEVTPKPEATQTPEPSESPEPKETPEPSESPEPEETPEPAEETEAPEPEETPEPSETPEAEDQD